MSREIFHRRIKSDGNVVLYFMIRGFRHLFAQYVPRNMHTVFALLCFVVVIHWLIFPYPSGLLHWHWGNLTIAPVPAKQPWWIWINTSCEFIMNDCITTTSRPVAYSCQTLAPFGIDIFYWVHSHKKVCNTSVDQRKTRFNCNGPIIVMIQHRKQVMPIL